MSATEQMTNRYFPAEISNRCFTAAVNFVLICFLFLSYYVITPQFEETFFMWKLIMYAADTFTKDFHHLNDVILWQDLLQCLQRIDSSIPWYPVLLTFFSGLSFLLLSNILLAISFRRSCSPFLSLTFLLLLAVAYMPNILWMHQNRTAFMMSGSALCLIYFAALYVSAAGKKKALYWIGVIWFAGGLCFRPEAAIAIFLLFFVYALFFQQRVQLLKMLLIPFLLIAVFFSAYQVNIRINPSFYYQLEPDTEYEIVDKRNVVPIAAMKNARDSARYTAITSYWMLADVKQTPPSFIKSLIQRSNDISPDKRWHLFLSRLNPETYRLLVDENLFTILAFVLLLCMPHKSRKVSLLMLCCGAMLMSLSFTVNIYLRVVQPLLFIIFGFLLFHFFHYGPKLRFSHSVHFAIVLSAIGLLTLSFRSHHHQAVSIKQTQQHIKQTIDQVLARYQKRSMVVIAGDFIPFNTGAFNAHTGFEGKKLLVTEFGQFSGNPAFLASAGKVTGCSATDFVCKMEYIQQQQDNIILFGKKKNISFYSQYLRAVYGANWNLQGEYIPLDDDSYILIPRKNMQ